MKYATLELIDDVLSQKLEIESSLIFSPSKKREVLEARQIFQYFGMTLTKISCTKVGAYGQIYGVPGKDHVTVLHSRNKISDWIEIYPKWGAKIEYLKNKILDLCVDESELIDEKELLKKSKKIIAKRIMNCRTRPELNKILHKSILL